MCAFAIERSKGVFLEQWLLLAMRTAQAAGIKKIGFAYLAAAESRGVLYVCTQWR